MERELIVNIHSICGATVFFIGLAQLLLRKSGSLHKYLGYTYILFWLVLLGTGAYIGGALITTVGIFGIYYAITGGRLANKKIHDLGLLDKGFMIAGSFTSLLMLYYSGWLYFSGDTSFAIIFLVFGLIFLTSTIQDISKYVMVKESRKYKYGVKHDWLFEHIARMSISYIAAVTAYTSVQNVFGNTVLNFLLPTIVGTALIEVTKRKYAKKMKLS